MNCFMRTDRQRPVVPAQCVSARLDRSQVGLFCIVSVIGSTSTYAFMARRGTTVLCECFRLFDVSSCAPGRLPNEHYAGHVDTERPACACFRHAWSADIFGSDSRMINA